MIVSDQTLSKELIRKLQLNELYLLKEFNDFCFEGKPGDKGVVKTQFGYHYIEIEDQKNFETAYKIAYLAQR